MKKSMRNKTVRFITSLLLAMLMVWGMGLEGMELLAQAAPVYSNVVTVEPTDTDRPEGSALSEMEQLLAACGGRAYVQVTGGNTKVYDSADMGALYGKVGSGLVLATGYHLSGKGTPNLSILFEDGAGTVRTAHVPVARVSIPASTAGEQAAIAAGLREGALHFADGAKELPIPVISFQREGKDEFISAEESIDFVHHTPEALPEGFVALELGSGVTVYVYRVEGVEQHAIFGEPVVMAKRGPLGSTRRIKRGDCWFPCCWCARGPRKALPTMRKTPRKK